MVARAKEVSDCSQALGLLELNRYLNFCHDEGEGVGMMMANRTSAQGQDRVHVLATGVVRASCSAQVPEYMQLCLQVECGNGAQLIEYNDQRSCLPTCSIALISHLSTHHGPTWAPVRCECPRKDTLPSHSFSCMYACMHVGCPACLRRLACAWHPALPSCMLHL
jgi:hypothetical protein